MTKKKIGVLGSVVGLMLFLGYFKGYYLGDTDKKNMNNHNGYINIKNLSENDIKDRSIFRPIFETEEGEFSAGTTFLVEDGKRVVGITAGHVFGPSGGLEERLNGEEIADYVKDIKLFDVYTKEYVVSGGEFWNIKYVTKEKNINSDMAIFDFDVNIENVKIDVFKLSEKKLEQGDPVWLAGKIVEGEGTEKRLHRGIVEKYEDGYLIFKYDNEKISLKATSGAPILDENKQIVGINIGGRKENDTLYGYANPIENIKAILDKVPDTLNNKI